MKNILNYIAKGKGYGLVFLLASSIVIATVYVFIFKNLCKEVEPSLFLVAEDILPITVKDGKIVEPENEYKDLDLKITPTESLKVVLDTREDVIKNRDKYGFYISKDGLFVSISGDMKKIELGDGVIDIEKFKSWYNTFIGAVGVYNSIIAIVASFIIALFKVLAILLCCMVNKKIAKDKILLSNEQIMRLSSIWVAGVEVLLLIFKVLLGVVLSEFFVFAILVIVIMRSARFISRDADLLNE